MSRRKGLIRSITEAVGERERVEDEPAPTVDELVAFPEIDFDDPSELLGVAYDQPDEEEYLGVPEDVVEHAREKAATDGWSQWVYYNLEEDTWDVRSSTARVTRPDNDRPFLVVMEDGRVQNYRTKEDITEVSKKELDAQAKLVHGGLSQTSKMPCKSFPLPPGATCPAGSKSLQTDPYSVCRVCYAKTGRQAMPRMAKGKKNRLELLRKAMRSKTARDRWVGEMVGSIERQGPYFRWHDSGDIFKPEYLDLIVQIVRETSGTQHWIPTKQEAFVKDWVSQHGADAMPPNMCVRISAMRINEEKRQPRPFTASSVYISEPPARSFPCPATWDAGHIQRYGRRFKTKAGPGIEPTCGPCRACWDRNVSQVCYRYHGHASRLPDELQKEFKGRQDVMGPILKRMRAEG